MDLIKKSTVNLIKIDTISIMFCPFFCSIRLKMCLRLIGYSNPGLWLQETMIGGEMSQLSWSTPNYLSDGKYFIFLEQQKCKVYLHRAWAVVLYPIICINPNSLSIVSDSNRLNPFASGIPKVLLSPITGLFSVKIR